MSAPNPSVAQARVLVDELRRCGVTDVVVAPGSRSTALAMAFHADPRIRLHVRIDERSASFVALGIGRITRRPVPVVTTSGTAVANLLPAVVEADLAGVPLLILSADRPPELRDTGANQAIDQIRMFGDRVRWACELGVAEDRPDAVALWRSTAARAVGEAVGWSGRPGPVHVNLPFREPTVPAEDDGRRSAPAFGHDLAGRPDDRPWLQVHRRTAAPAGDVVADVVRTVSGARGVIGLADPDADPAGVATLAALLGWPVVVEPPGRAEGPNVIPHASAHLTATIGHLRPDVVLLIGRTSCSRALTRMVAEAEEVLVVSASGAWVDPARTATQIVSTDADALLSAVADAAPAAAPADWLARWQAVGAAADEVVAARATGLDEPAVARTVVAATPAGGLVVVASSMPIRDVETWATPRADLALLANRGASGIDGFVSTAIGAASAHEGPTTVLCGDLSFLHDRNGLLVPGEERVGDITFVVVDNDGGGIFHFLPQADHAGFERLFGTAHGIDLTAVGATHGLDVVEVASVAELAATVAAPDGWRLVVVSTDRNANRSVHTDLEGAVTEAVQRALASQA